MHDFLMHTYRVIFFRRRCEELWDTLINNEDCIEMDKGCLFVWFTNCFTDLEDETKKLLYEKKLLSLPVCSVSHTHCLQE